MKNAVVSAGEVIRDFSGRYAEMTHPPFELIMTESSIHVPEGAMDITSFTRYGYEDRKDIMVLAVRIVDTEDLPRPELDDGEDRLPEV